jgi:serine/threonine protein kinase
MRRVGEIEYTHDHEIGQGQGRSKVYLASDHQRGGKVAVKEILKTGFRDFDEYWTESKAMRSAEHEHVVPILYGCQIEDHVCIAMPYYKNGSLADKIRNGPIPPSEIVRLGTQVLSGLTKIHGVPLVHFDVKPSNILIDDNDRARVADLGQAQPIGPHGIANIPELVYGLGFPPESLSLLKGIPESDIYQVGVTLYRAANGDPFFKAQRPGTQRELLDQIRDGLFPNRDAFMPHVPRSHRMILRRAMSVDPSQRYGSAREFASALGKATYSHDWRMANLANGEIEWTSARAPGPDLVVRLSNDSPKWKVTVHHARPGKQTKTKGLFWKNGLTRRDGLIHLRRVFESLE